MWIFNLSLDLRVSWRSPNVKACLLELVFLSRQDSSYQPMPLFKKKSKAHSLNQEKDPHYLSRIKRWNSRKPTADLLATCFLWRKVKVKTKAKTHPPIRNARGLTLTGFSVSKWLKINDLFIWAILLHPQQIVYNKRGHLTVSASSAINF